jgi:uncharacterized membrane protein YbhN (UPF0104 family)
MADDVTFDDSGQSAAHAPPPGSTAPVTTANASAPQAGVDDDEEMPRVKITRRRTLLAALFVISALAFLYVVLPKLTGLHKTWNRLGEGDPWWLAVAFVCELLSFLSYVWLFRTVFVRAGTRIGWRASYEITMAGVAATRLFAAAGAGGIALTAWALRRSGMERRIVARRMIAFLGLLYIVYIGGMLIGALGLRLHVFEGDAPFGFTVVPAIFAATCVGLAGLICLLPHDVERRLEGWAQGGGRFARIMARAITVPASAAIGLRTAIRILAGAEPGAMGALGWWAFDISCLWATFHAFGHAPPIAVLVTGYFVGQLANTLPLPGGIGGVEGGLIGSYAAFGVDPGLALVAVLVYRGFAFWLPIVPGAIAYAQLRKRVAGWREERLMASEPEAVPT